MGPPLRLQRAADVAVAPHRRVLLAAARPRRRPRRGHGAAAGSRRPHRAGGPGRPLGAAGPALGRVTGGAGGDGGPAAERWRAALEAWALPEAILAQAPEDPWRLPVEPFLAVAGAPLSVSHRRALEALPPGGRVLDVGAGGGAMSRPLAAAGAHIVAVDTAEEMLAASGAATTVLGRWPDVAPVAGIADVVVCGHVLYNCPDLAAFARALGAAAQRRVVVEITDLHPRVSAEDQALWHHFWQLERPEGPGWEDAVAVLREVGIEPAV
ncbi:MAG: methyltransferase domain-containing protein, partial [Chloroflexi bacterium]